MSFAAPLHLLALLAIPLVGLVWWMSHQRRRRFAVRHPATDAIARALPPRRRRRTVLPVALVGASAASLAIAYAKPERTVRVPVEKASVVLVTDESGSMDAADVAPTRIDAARAAARTFIDQAPSSLMIGFEAFASTVSTNISPSTDRTDVEQAIQALQPLGGTASGDALTAALDGLQARKGNDGQTAPAAIVLLSDGARTVGSDPEQAAARAKQLGIPIYTVALGTSDGTIALPDGRQVPVPPDPQTLSRVAEISGGRAYSAADADTLDAVYRQLGSRVGTRAEQREVTVAFIAGGLVLLLGGLAAGTRVRGGVV